MATWTREHEQLLHESMRWAASASYDPVPAVGMRRATLRANHRHYRRNVPLYRQLADRAGVGDDASFETLARTMLLPDGIFKSYPQSLLDRRDFAGMNAWLRTIFDRDISVPVDGVANVDEWLAALGKRGVHAV